MPLPEKQLIERIRIAQGRRLPPGGKGIGDDAAVLRVPPGDDALVTTDFTLEDIHFRREWHPPDAVGHRCLARGLSDIAAMGGTPRAAFLSLAVPADLPQSWVDGFIAGLLKLARRHSIPLAGGDTAQSPNGILADIVVVGSAPRGTAILRSGAKPGDLIYVTGTLGSSAATLHELRDGKELRPQSRLKHFYPEPRVKVGQWLREKKLVSAMIDISDGLSTDLAHICKESRVGAVVDRDILPIASGLGADALLFALHGGEEYELLFTAPPSRRIPKQIAKVPVTRVGEVVRGKSIKLRMPDGKNEILKAAGWEHFA